MSVARLLQSVDRGVAIKITAVLGAELLVFAGAMFGAAGTDDWTGGWIFLTIVMASVVPAAVGLLIHDPDLLEERTRLAPSGQPLADRIFVPVHSLTMLLWAAVAGYDGGRAGWSHVPMGLRVGAALFIPWATWVGYRIMRENPFLTTCVIVQDGRDHRVVDSGAYAIVRHPFYSITLLYQVSASLVLGSWISLALVGVVGAMLATRVLIEEQHLERNLSGYAAYMGRTRWRLIPGLW